ncbi:LAETG motif-containing sortase-dependent surface protein [Streptomyces roseolus]|uniref:LAETG motif-containing sortase-dependent surface protein n=1 Tax=Streptomyces roseolus TaxID=67358 RepID=UPI0037894613
MKIRRMLATAVAAAVTTPVVLLSAGPAFAETPKPTRPATAQDEAPDGPEEDDFAEYEKLIEAVAAAEAKLESLKAERKALVEDLRAGNIDEAVKTEYNAAKLAYDEAKTARGAADTALVEAQADLDAVTADPNATAEAKATAEQAVADAKEKAEAALTAEKDAKTRFVAADTAWSDARVALARQISLLDPKIEAAEQELADAEAALEAYEGEDCVEDRSVVSTLTGPKSITIGSSADFSLTVKNTSDRDLDSVRSYLFAAHVPESWDDILDEEDPDLGRYFSIDWKSAANPEWTELDFEDEAIELGAIAEGGKADVTLRLSVAEDAPAGEGLAFTTAEYDNGDGSCGISEQYAKVDFDIVEPKGEPTEQPTTEPTEQPTAAPSPSTSAPAPTPAPSSNGAAPQGGRGGELAETGSSDVLPRLGAAAGAAVVLGAGAVFVARRRKADA